MFQCFKQTMVVTGTHHPILEYSVKVPAPPSDAAHTTKFYDDGKYNKYKPIFQFSRII